MPIWDAHCKILFFSIHKFIECLSNFYCILVLVSQEYCIERKNVVNPALIYSFTTFQRKAKNLKYNQLFYVLILMQNKQIILLGKIYYFFSYTGYIKLPNNVSAWALNIPSSQKSRYFGTCTLFCPFFPMIMHDSCMCTCIW